MVQASAAELAAVGLPVSFHFFLQRSALCIVLAQSSHTVGSALLRVYGMLCAGAVVEHRHRALRTSVQAPEQPGVIVCMAARQQALCGGHSGQVCIPVLTALLILSDVMNSFSYTHSSLRGLGALHQPLKITASLELTAAADRLSCVFAG